MVLFMTHSFSNISLYGIFHIMPNQIEILKKSEALTCYLQSKITHKMYFTTHLINSRYNFSVQNCYQNSDRVQLRSQSPERCIIKHLKNTKLCSIELLRTAMTSNPHQTISENTHPTARIHC